LYQIPFSNIRDDRWWYHAACKHLKYRSIP
jgi:hypothetical protein